MQELVPLRRVFVEGGEPFKRATDDKPDKDEFIIIVFKLSFIILQSSSASIC